MTSRGTGIDWNGWVRFGIPGLALGLGLAWFLGGREPSAQAQSSGPTRGASQGPDVSAAGAGAGTFAFTAPAAGNAQLLYVVDTRARAFVVYRIDPANPKGTVKLEAARQYQWDLKLSEYNNLEPGVASIESMVKSLGPPNR